MHLIEPTITTSTSTSTTIDNNNNNNKINITDLPIEILFHIFSIENENENSLDFNNIITPIIINLRGLSTTTSTSTSQPTTSTSISIYNQNKKKTLLNSIIQFSLTCKYLYNLFQDESFWYSNYLNYFSNYSFIDKDCNLNLPTITTKKISTTTSCIINKDNNNKIEISTTPPPSSSHSNKNIKNKIITISADSSDDYSSVDNQHSGGSSNSSSDNETTNDYSDNLLHTSSSSSSSWKNRFIKRNHPWNYKDINCKKEIQGEKGITSLEVDDNYLFSGSHAAIINLYEMNNQLNNEKSTICSGGSREDDIDESTNTGSTNSTGTLSFKGHQSTIWALKSDGKRLYSGSNDHTIRIWDLKKKKCKSIIRETSKIFSIDTINNKSNDNGSSSISSSNGNSNHYIFSSCDNNIKVWNRKTLKLETTLKGHTGGINKIQIRDNSILYSGSSDGSVKIWDLNKLKLIGSRIDRNDKILSLQTVNSNILVTGSQNCQIKFWDLRCPSTSSSNNNDDIPIVSLLNAHKWEVWQLEMCGGYLFSGSFDHTIKIWDLNNFQNLSTISSHRSYIHALTSSSFHLFSGSADKFIKVWSPSSS